MSTAGQPAGSFAARLRGALDRHGPLCVGIDPHPGLLAEWGLPDDAAGLEQFARTVVEAVAGEVAAVKPQSAFFERHGSAGVAVLERVLADLAAVGTMSVLDVKRGDVGSTMTAYAQAYLGDGSPLAADAVTLSPYLGYGSLRPAIELARETGRGVFVLTLTSNPEGSQVQHAGTPSVAQRVLSQVAADNAGAEPFGHVGVVVGATVGSAIGDLGLDLAGSRAPVLAPGVGAQGATAADLATTFAGSTGRLLVPVSRGVLAGPPGEKSLRHRMMQVRDQIGAALS